MGAAKVPGTIMGERASLVQKKAYALNRLVQKPFLNKRTTGSVQLYDDGTHGDKTAGDGTYSAHAPQLRYDGVYNLAIVAEAFDGLGDCLRREVSIAQYVAISFTRESIGKHLAWASVSVTPYFGAELKKILSEQPQAGYERRSVVFTPQDSFGNYWGPGHAAEIRFAFKGGSPLGPIVDNLDGRYVQVVEYKKGEPPTVEVSAAGVTGELESRLPEAADWWKSWYIYLILILIALVVALRKKLFP
jgi:hypothetical protein